ncbi:MAG: hypothetical protein ACKO3Q_02275 [Betaproteobacteria bacterium]
MTSIAGYSIRGAVCCGAHYKTARYASMNFMSSAFWTDGYREQSLMPNDQGLRRCTCGKFFLQRDLVEMAQVDQSDLPWPPRVDPADLPLAIAQADSPALELAARTDYWLELNHAYRDLYRAHRDEEDAATQAAWEAANPDRRNFWQRWRTSERRPQYRPSPDRPLTFPVFEATQEQRENMQALLRLMQPLGSDYDYERVELHRELGQFDEAAQALRAAKESDSPTMHKLSTELIAEGHAAPVRYSA